MMIKKPLVLFLCILIIAIFFRLVKLTNIPPGLYPDEAINGNQALEALKTHHFRIFYKENNGREGLFINLQAFFLKIFLKFFNNQTEPWMLRFVSAFFGILTIPGFYFFLKEIFNKNPSKEKTALWGSFLLAISFWHLNFSRIGFRAILVPFFLVWSFFFLFLSFRKEKIILIILAGLFFGLGFYTYPAFRFVPFLILIFLIFHFRKFFQEKKLSKFFLLTIIFLLVTFITLLPLMLYFLKNPDDFLFRTSQISIFTSSSPFLEFLKSSILTSLMFNFLGDGNWRHNFASRPLLDPLTGLFFLLGLGLIIRNFQKEKFLAIFFLSWLFFLSLPATLTREGLPHALRSIGLIPPTFLLAGLGASYLSQFFEKNKILFATLIIFLLISNLGSYFFIWAKKTEVRNAFSEPYRQIGYYLRNLPSSLNKYLIVNANGVLVEGIPMPAQTIMFLTQTAKKDDQKKKNLFYLLKEEISQIDFSSPCVIIPLEKEEDLKNLIFQKNPQTQLLDYESFWVFQIYD